MSLTKSLKMALPGASGNNNQTISRFLGNTFHCLNIREPSDFKISQIALFSMLVPSLLFQMTLMFLHCQFSIVEAR